YPGGWNRGGRVDCAACIADAFSEVDGSYAVSFEFSGAPGNCETGRRIRGTVFEPVRGSGVLSQGISPVTRLCDARMLGSISPAYGLLRFLCSKRGNEVFRGSRVLQLAKGLSVIPAS